MTLVYCQRLDSRNAIKLGDTFGFYRVGVAFDKEATPIRVAEDRAILDTPGGGGDILYPGDAGDFRMNGVWVKPPTDGSFPFVWCENRTQITAIHRHPMGFNKSIGGSKVYVFTVEEARVWRNITSNIAGMVAWEARAEGGLIWVGSHLDTTKPPYEQDPNAGNAWPLSDGQTMRDVGNPYLFIWSEQVGAKLRFRKTLGGFGW